jgi:methyltransferase-like protein/cyclopropane fatty-acyl-phospholipid synthase-like methyltransferase
VYHPSVRILNRPCNASTDFIPLPNSYPVEFMTPPATPYDEVLYPSAALAQTHPDRLATIATLMGMCPAPVERCRVLELACGDGANLIPMAFNLPGSQFVGLDLAVRPIAQGQALMQALGLKNIRLEAANLLDMTPAWGEFDYIIAHGLYAWVPSVVQDKLLAVCRENLAPNGVAYVSYNTYPGSHLRQMMREMMLFHLRQNSVPQAQVEAQAKALASFLATPRGKLDAFQNFMRAEAEAIQEHADGHLFHDELAETFCPVYFHQFAAHAARHQLQYLAEADFFEMQDRIYPESVVAGLERMASTRLLREQYLDFLKCRRFRQTLLCHAKVKLTEQLDPNLVPRFWFSSPAKPASSQLDFASPKCERFVGRRGAAMETDHVLTKTAMGVLGRAWPHQLAFDELLRGARHLLGQTGDAEADETRTLCEILLQAYSAGIVEFHLYSPEHAVQPGERPAASALARQQIQQGEIVTNVYHQPVKIEGVPAKALLQLLDGTRCREELAVALTSLAGAAGAADDQLCSTKVGEQIEAQLVKLAKLGLLIA